jgi:hypothetical protein
MYCKTKKRNQKKETRKKKRNKIRGRALVQGHQAISVTKSSPFLIDVDPRHELNKTSSWRRDNIEASFLARSECRSVAHEAVSQVRAHG